MKQQLLSALCRANQGILQQKLGLLQALARKHGRSTAQELFRKTCPIVHATIGQHLRHSLDHMEMAVSNWQEGNLHYDLRTRGGLDETDWDAATARIQRVSGLLEDLSKKGGNDDKVLLQIPVQAYFMLSGDTPDEYALTSTVSRELGFAAHHAIHHMAMVRIMATCEHVGQLSDHDLPADFGRAPSTVNFDHTQQ